MLFVLKPVYALPQPPRRSTHLPPRKQSHTRRNPAVGIARNTGQKPLDHPPKTVRTYGLGPHHNHPVEIRPRLPIPILLIVLKEDGEKELAPHGLSDERVPG
jgi:hypothetical protein